MQEHPTKFTMISSPCVSARFLGQSVFVVAIDTMFCIKIWDYKKNILMQSIQQSKLKMHNKITGLLIFSEGKIAVTSKHITFYDTISSRQSDSNAPHFSLNKKELEIRRTILREKGLSEIQ